MEYTENPKRIELAFPKFDEQEVAKGFGEDIVARFSTSIEEITKVFQIASEQKHRQ